MPLVYAYKIQAVTLGYYTLPRILFFTYIKTTHNIFDAIIYFIVVDIVIINNKLYIIIGAKAAKVFFPKENFNELIFKDNYINEKRTIVLPHPSPLNL